MSIDNTKETKIKDYCECSIMKAETCYDKYIKARKIDNAKPFDKLEEDEKLVWLSMAGRKPLPERKEKSEMS